MSAISPLPLSERIIAPLKEVALRQWTVLAAKGVLQTLVVSLLVLLFSSLVLGFATEVPAIIRIILAIFVWAIVISSALRALRPALRRWSLSNAAQHAEMTVAGSNERISSAVELSQSNDDFRGSPQLIARLVSQAEGDVQKVNAAAVVPFTGIFWWALAFVPVLALWAALALNGHTARLLLRGLFSTLMPWKSAPIFLADVAVKPGDAHLAEGDALKIDVTVSSDGGKPATRADLVKSFDAGQSVSQNLDQVAGTQFAINLENLQQSFKYKISTDRGDSHWYNVIVDPRPAIARLDLHYDYPKYTAQEPRQFTASDGAIDAIAGTHLTLTIHTTDAIVNDKSQLLFDEGLPTQSTVALTPTGEKNVYEAKFDVTHSGEYRIQLLNNYNLGNKDDDPRIITAEADEPPTIAIEYPAQQITVRSDDDVTVQYSAKDDFGVARIDALVQVDERPQRTIPVVIRGKDRKNIHENWMLSIPAILKQEGVGEASRIAYQLQVTDNRDPDPQTGLSLRQILLVSRSETRSFQDKLLQKEKEELQAAIRKAIDRLNQVSGRVATLRDHLSRDTLGTERLREAADARDHVSLTGRRLAQKASEYLATPFAKVAQEAKNIADKQIAQAADDTARISLDSADMNAGHADGERAYNGIIAARDALERLLEKTEEANRVARAADMLKQAARQQDKVAKAMAEHPEKADQNREKQEQAIQKLDEAIRNDPSLANQPAQQLAAKLAELENKIDQDQNKQTELQNQTEKQEEKQQAQQEANKLAEDQKKLNKDVQQLAKDEKKTLEQAHAQTPDANQQNDLVKNIEHGDIQRAADQAKDQANQLKREADQLKQMAKNPAANPSPDQQNQRQQDQQNKQDAADTKSHAEQAANDLKNQARQDQPNADAAKQAAQNVKHAAEQVEHEADKVEQANQQGAKDAHVQQAAEAAKADAQQAAEEAQQAAAAPDKTEAQKDADQAAKELAKATNELNDAAGGAAAADQAAADQQAGQAAAQAADQAQAQADKQQEIAQALAEQAQQVADAQQNAPAPQQQADQQKQLAQQTQEAKQATHELAKQAAEQKDMALQKHAEEAAKALDQAAQAQQEAAKDAADAKPDGAAQAQANAQQALAQAQQALRGETDPPAAADAQNPPDANGQGAPEQTAAQAAQQAAQAQRQAQHPDPAAAGEAARELAQAAKAAEQGLPGNDPDAANEPGTDPGQDASDHPGQSPDSKQGLVASDTGGNNQPPASVKALGISASDWAKLPPLMQKELMSASQQSGPPAYKQMIKNYYIRVAHLQSDRPEAGIRQ